MLHTEVDRLGDENVAVLHRIALEVETVSREADEAFENGLFLSLGIFKEI